MESLDGELRDELLNGEIFDILRQARQLPGSRKQTTRHRMQVTPALEVSGLGQKRQPP